MSSPVGTRFPTTMMGSRPPTTTSVVTRSQPPRVTFNASTTPITRGTAPLANLPPSKNQLSSTPQYMTMAGRSTPTTVTHQQHHHQQIPYSTPSPSKNVQMIQQRGTPSPQSYTKFHDEHGLTTPSNASQKKKRRRARKKSGWQKLLCVEEMQELARKGPKMPDFGAVADAWGRRGLITTKDRGTYRPHNQYEFRDGPRLVSIDSTEDNWDLPPEYPDNLLPARSGPNQGRDADDFGITARDLFPWFANLVESCCCAEKKPRRALIRPRGEIQARGPQLETVCLDCGNVLEHHSMPQGLNRGALGQHMDWSHLAGGAPGGSSMMIDDGSQLPKYQGYKNWQVGGGCDHLNITARGNRSKPVPLPAFQVGPTRVFNNVPNLANTQHGLDVVDSDYHNVDDTGRVQLPNFEAKTTA